ncbi:putative replicative clamp [Vibrio phage VspDsh_1]|nr:putative replicative clamp [Vibrio phage VspDsh_1]
MLKELKFVMGSVSKKDFLPALSHFKIENQRATGYNGRISLSAPIDFDVDCIPKATPLVKALQQCEDTVVLGMTPAGKLSVKSGKFRSYIQCVDIEPPHPQPSGAFVDINGDQLLQALKTLEPLIADDASRPWSNGVLFSGSSAFATNNVIAAEYWLGSPFPCSVVIPRDAVKEILRLKEAPERFQMDDQSLTLHYSGDRWLRTLLIDEKWPDMTKVLTAPMEGMVNIPQSFYDSLDHIAPFTDKIGRVLMEEGKMMTHLDGDEEGAIVDCEFITNRSTFVCNMLRKLDGVATKLDLTQYPKPCPWVGENIRGVIIGLRWLEGRL